MPCVDTNANTKMAETEKNEVLKKSISEKHSQSVRLETIRGEAIVASGVPQKESGKSSLLKSVKSKIVEGPEE